MPTCGRDKCSSSHRAASAWSPTTVVAAGGPSSPAPAMTVTTMSQREGLAGLARPVLDLEHAVRPQERLRTYQSFIRDRLYRGPQEVRCTDFGTSRRGRPDRSGEGLCQEVGPTHQGREGHLLPG